MYKYTIAKVATALQQKRGELKEQARESRNPIEKYRLNARAEGVGMAIKEVELTATKMKATLRQPGAVTYVPKGEIWIRQQGFDTMALSFSVINTPITYIKKTAVFSAIEEDLGKGFDIRIRE